MKLRKLRVYDEKGDFVIEVPEDARVTFGYFNPTRDPDGGGYGRNQQFGNEGRKTALRIYGKSKEDQLAVFVGVRGFRDESISLTRMRERIVIEQNFEDDGDGFVKAERSERRKMIAAPEPDEYR